MAEIVGLVTGIGTIVATAFTIAKAISTVANDLGTAGSQIRVIATDTKALAFVMRDLKGRVMKNSRKFDSEAKSVLKETVALCTSEIENMQTHLMPLFHSKEGRKMELKQRARWLFAKSKVSTTKASLDSMKVTLGLLLHTIEYIEGDAVEDFIEEDIHEMIATSKGTKEKFLRAQRIDMTVEVIYDRITSHQTPETATDTQTQPSIGSHEQSQVNNGDGVTNHIMHMAGFQGVSSGLVLRSERQNVDLDGALTAEFDQTSLSTEWALIETLSDEKFLQIADHMRLQKRVVGFALETMTQPGKSEGYVSESEQTTGVAEEGLADRWDQTLEASSADDNAGQETSTMSSVHLGSGPEASRRHHPHEAQYDARQGQRLSDGHRGHEKRSRVYRPDAQEPAQKGWSHLDDARSPSLGGSHRESPSSPGMFDYFNGEASSSRHTGRSPERASGWASPRASGQQADLYGEDNPNMRNPYMPGRFQQKGNPPSSHSGAWLNPDPFGGEDFESLKSELAQLKLEKQRMQEAKERKEWESSIREDAERAFRIRMEEMQRAQEDVKEEVASAQARAERAARERIEEERRAEAERQRQHAEVMAKAEWEARQGLEKEVLERKQRQGLRGLLNRFSKS